MAKMFTRGTDPLEDQRRSLRAHETFGNRLMTFKSSDDSDDQGNPQNAAEFVDEENPLPDLVFLEVPDAGLLGQVIAEQKAKGRSFIFSSEVFVSSQKEFVAGFREKP